MSTKRIRARLHSGRWQEIFPGVYFVGGTRPTWETRLAAAVAWAGPGAAAAARSVGALFGLDGCRKGPPEVITTRPVTRGPVRCHRTNLLPKHHIRRKEGIRITSVARAVFDMAGLVPYATLYAVATDALRKKLTSLGELRAILHELQASGRNGTVAMRTFLEEYDPRLSLTANQFEAELFKILQKAGLPLPEPQQPIRDDKGRIMRVDFLYLGRKIVLEAEGFVYHDDPQALARDNDRRNSLQLDGWLVLAFGWDKVMFRPDEIVKEVADALGQR